MNQNYIVVIPPHPIPIDTIVRGDCVEVMRQMPSASVDFILTDPPYITRYMDRSGRTVINDDNSQWLEPTFRQMYRLLKHGSSCVSFYGWNNADLFINAWRAAGFRIVGHIVFRKRYTSSMRFMRAGTAVGATLSASQSPQTIRMREMAVCWPLDIA